MSWVVIQEGGSSDELYCRFYDSEDHAETFRRDASIHGAYRSTEPVFVGEAVTVLEKGDLLQQIIDSLQTLA